MSKIDEIIPNLRFPEFSAPWSKSKVGDRGKFIGGGTPDSDVEKFWNGEIPWISSSDVPEDEIYVRNITRYITEEAVKESATKIIPKGSVLIVSRVGIGKFAVSRDKICTSQDFTNLVPSKDLPIFLAYLFKTKKSKFLGYSQGTSIKGITTGDIKSLRLFFPIKKEQQKIADFLSSVDQKIQQLKRKQELLEEYKKGVMQKLFSQEIRFKDENGDDFPDWEYKELGDISDRITDKNEDEEYDFVLTNSAVQGVVSQTEYFDKSIANKSNLGGYYIVKKDDFVYNPRISSEAPVGPIKRNKLKTGVMSPLYSVFRISKKNLDFFEYFFETTLWHRYMHSVANFGARHDRMNITVGDFQKLPIPFPSEKEREKATDFINSVSEKLKIVNRKLELAEKFKKGLLQKMFV